MDFAYTPRVEDLRRRVRDFISEYITPRIRQYHEEAEAGVYPISFMPDLKELARDEGCGTCFCRICRTMNRERA